MVENIKTLRKICQKEKIEDKKQELWYTPHRKISIYITKILLHTPITANQVTIISILCGFVGAILLSLNSFQMNLFGFLGFYIYYLLDKVDGEVARYRKKISLKGIYLDEVGHLITPVLFFVSITINLFNVYSSQLVMYSGLIAAFASCFFRINTNLGFMIFSKKVLFNKQLRKQAGKISEKRNIFSRETILGERIAGRKIKKSIIRTLREFLIALSQLIIFLLLFLLTFLADHYKKTNYTTILIISYSVYFILISLFQIVILYFSDLENQIKNLYKKI